MQVDDYGHYRGWLFALVFFPVMDNMEACAISPVGLHQLADNKFVLQIQRRATKPGPHKTTSPNVQSGPQLG